MARRSVLSEWKLPGNHLLPVQDWLFDFPWIMDRPSAGPGSWQITCVPQFDHCPREALSLRRAERPGGGKPYTLTL